MTLSRVAVGLPARFAAVLIAAAVLLAGCAGSPPGDAARIDAKLTADLDSGDVRAVGQAVNAFGFDLFAEVADGRQNTVTSPLSVAVLLALVLAGAGGDTAGETAAVLRLDDRRDVRVGALLRMLSDTDQVTLSVADAIWADRGTPLDKDYLEFVRRAFGATVEQDDLGSADAARAIDAWADKNTNGRIDRIAADLGLPDPQVVLVLLNAVYFLGEWTTRFDRGDTRPQPFTRPDGKPVDVPMMRSNGEKLGYTERDGYRMVRLPYGKDRRYGMEVLLPDEDRTLAELLKSLDAAQWRAAVDSLTEQTIDSLTLPRFETRWKGALNDPLRRLGMSSAFTPGKADFRPMSPSAPSLATVVHKTYIRVDEQGTEAAAVTGGAMVLSAPANPIAFHVDRPFAFTISDRRTGAILFLGAITDPTS